MHDVVVVGGGPAGCHTASLLSQRGLDVQVLEEHSAIGEPVDCSGVIGAESFDALNVSSSLKLGTIRTLNLVSPSGLEVKFAPPFPLAYIIDRAAFDRFIAEKTIASGATLRLGSRVADLYVTHDGVDVYVTRKSEVVTRNPQVVTRNSEVVTRSEVQSPTFVASSQFQVPSSELPVTNYDSRFTNNEVRERLRARVVILAGGPRYRFQSKLGMGQPKDFIKTAQIETTTRGINEAKVYLGSQVAPGSFAWIVPFKRAGGEFARIGVSTKGSPAPFLKQLIERLYSEGHLSSPDVPIRSWVIPLAPLKKSYADRVLAVGDAAGQTKPTTGGGIYYSLLCGEAAATATLAAFEKGDYSANTLSLYERIWRRRLAREIRAGSFFRRLAERLGDSEIDEIFRLVRSDGILATVAKKARFDWHSDVIHFALRHPALGRIFLKGLFR